MELLVVCRLYASDVDLCCSENAQLISAPSSYSGQSEDGLSLL